MPNKINTEIFIERSKNIHGDRYQYNCSEYINSQTKISVRCPIHGIFTQKPQDHMNGRGCEKCGKLIWENKDNLEKRFNIFAENANRIHNFRYKYILESYNGTHRKGDIICPIHGKFTQLLTNHLSGSGCVKCSKESYRNKRTFTDKIFTEKAIEKHGNFYNYSLINYTDSQSKLEIICPIHGKFTQKANAHLNGAGCGKCGKIKKSNNKSKNYDWYAKCVKSHGNKYNYSMVDYVKNTSPVKIICHKHGMFMQTLHSHIKGRGCPSCGVTNSDMENFVEEVLKDNSIDYVKNDWSVLKNLELDFYIPSMKIAIECNGNYWHSETSGNKDKDYHLDKTEKCLGVGIKLLHIFEDEYIEKREIIKCKILNVLNLTKYKIWAEECSIERISEDIKDKFLNKYHIQGSDKSDYMYGLFYRDRIVAVMTFCGASNSKNRVFDFSRYSSLGNFDIVGGVDKLLTFFKVVTNPSKIILSVDRRFSDGDLYEKIGFERVSTTPPDYWYLIRNGNYFTRKYKSELDNMKTYNFDRIWDCGMINYEMFC